MDANPYASPPVVNVPTFPWRVKETLRELAPLLWFGPITGALTGGSINVINGWVGPEYFSEVMGWQDHIWLRSICQGGLEGAAYGLGNSLLFIVLAIFYSREKIARKHLKRILILISLLAFGCSQLGGISLTALSFIRPGLVFGDQGWWFATSSQLNGFAFARGSVAFACYGSPLYTLVLLTLLVYRQRRAMRQLAPSDGQTAS